MPDFVNRHPRLLLAATTTAVAASALAIASSATGANLGQLNQQLSSTQAQEHSLSADISSLDAQVTRLSGQISLLQSRERTVQQELTRDRSAVTSTRAELRQQRVVLKREQARLALSRKMLADQLVSQYENPEQSLVSVVLSSNGFAQMLSQLDYLHNTQSQQQNIIGQTRRAQAETEAVEARIAKLERADQTALNGAELQSKALAGMQRLLDSREAALSHARQAKADALAASRSHGAALESQISKIKAQEAAAAAAAARIARQNAAAAAASNSSSSTTATSSGGASTATDGWAIPYAIVLCESGGQNLPPNSAGASGYYQIIPATWRGEGGTGPAAYLASKAEQSAIAAKLWDGGAGARNWVCAGIVGIN